MINKNFKVKHHFKRFKQLTLQFLTFKRQKMLILEIYLLNLMIQNNMIQVRKKFKDKSFQYLRLYKIRISTQNIVRKQQASS